MVYRKGVAYVEATEAAASVKNISWRSVLLVEENHQPVASHLQTLSHNVVSSTPMEELLSYM